MPVQLPENRAALLTLIEQEHAQIDLLLAKLEVSQMETPGVAVGWTPELEATNGGTVKDILAHLTAWERRMLAYIAVFEANETMTEARYLLTAPKYNRLVYVESRSRPLAEVLNDYRNVYAEVLTMAHDLEETALLRYTAEGVLRYNTYNHYRWAIKKLRPLLRKLSRKA